MEKFQIDCYNILTFGIDIIGSYVNIIRALVFCIILHLFLLHVLLEGEEVLTLGFFFHKLSI